MALVTNFKRLEEEYNTHVRGSDDFIRLIELIKEGKSYDANSTISLFEQFIKAEASSLNSSDISKILDKTRDESDKNKSFMIKYYMLSSRSLELTKDGQVDYFSMEFRFLNL